MLSEVILRDAESQPQTIEYKTKKGLLTLADQEEILALKRPFLAYFFAREVPGSNIEKCQEIACIEPYWAYKFSFIKAADIERCRKVCEGTPYAF